MTDAEEFYVAARVLEEVAKDEDDTEGAAVCARVAEAASDGRLSDIDGILDDVEEDGRRSAERLRLALNEIRDEGEARITENVDDAVVAHLRDEF